MPPGWTPPAWVYVDSRPETDVQYFSNMTRCIFQGGLNWVMIANKWPNFEKAFDNFDYNKVAKYGLEDQERLRNDAGIIRNKQKIMATIQNAEEFQRIIREHDSFQKWLDGLDKSNNYKVVIGRLRSRFKRVGPSTAHIFLWSIGEPIEYDTSVFTRRPKKVA
jgi:3-methyladenine DNA glycosylase Tag